MSPFRPISGKESFLTLYGRFLVQDPLADEILVIDQTPEHEANTESSLKEWHESGKITWIKHSPPNLPGARNRALRETKCDIIIFIDDDVVIEHDFVRRHFHNYKDPETAAVGGRIIQEGKRKPRTPKKPWPRVMDPVFFDHSGKVRVSGIASFQGCNHSARVKVLRAIGGFDETYIGLAHREESDVAIRLWKAGYRIDFDPEAVLTHLAASSGGCRKHDSMREWKISFPSLYFSVRHWFPNRWFWQHIFIKGIRTFVLRRENVVRPWLLPWAFAAYWYALARAFSIANKPARAYEPAGWVEDDPSSR